MIENLENSSWESENQWGCDVTNSQRILIFFPIMPNKSTLFIKLSHTMIAYIIIRIMAVAIIHFILGLTHALLVVTFTITLRTLTSIPIQNRKNLSFPVTAKLLTLSAIESRAAKRLQTHLESLRRLCNCAVPICATNMRNYLFRPE